MKSYPDKKVCVYDLGLFVCIAEAIAPHFKKTYYYTPGKQSPFPKLGPCSIGSGVKGLERVNAWEPLLGKVDLWVFPDSLCGETIDHLRSLGERVWGPGMTEVLEQDRVEAKRYMADDLGLSIGKWHRITGTDALMSHMKDHPDSFIKTSLWRGDVETFNPKSGRSLERWAHKLHGLIGPYAHSQEFVVEECIEDCVEIGYDGYTVDGQYPKQSLFGIETKGLGYVGTFKEYRELPKQIRDTNAAMEDLLRENQCRSFFGMEMRVDKKGVPWVVDPMARFGSPPGELCSMIYSNLAEIIWEGAGGNIVDPVPAAKWGASLQMHSVVAEKEWLDIKYPASIKDNVKLRNFCEIDGVRWVIPQLIETGSLGAVVALGDTMDEAIEAVKDIASQVEAEGLEIAKGAVDSAKEAFAQLARLPGRIGPTKGGL